MPTNTNMPGSITSTFDSIETVLLVSTDSEILVAIVEGVMINMIYDTLVFRVQSADMSMCANCTLTLIPKSIYERSVSPYGPVVS